MEVRTLFSTLVVNSAADNSIPGDGLVTLREAIDAADNDTTTDTGQTGSTVDTITFDLGAGAHTIILTSALPGLYDGVTIKGRARACWPCGATATRTRGLASSPRPTTML